MSSHEQTAPRVSAVTGRISGMFDRIARALLLKSLTSITSGRLTLVDGKTRLEFGDPDSDLCARIHVHTGAFYRRVALGGTIGAAEAYMNGAWDCDDLPSLVRIMVRNQQAQTRMEKGLARCTAPSQRLIHHRNDNTRHGSRRNIAAHYDLGNDFYRLFLDPTMTYSCGFFEHSESTMEEASVAKFEGICKKLRLAPGMTLLEIGTGWGGFAIHAARHYDCRVTTTTISHQQFELAGQRIREAGLEDKIILLQKDYRNLLGEFDRVVSIEMIEAVGHQHLPTFFTAFHRRLAPGGLGLIQAITVPNRIYGHYVKNPDFINRYIFPGGCCPSLGILAQSAAKYTDLQLLDREELTPHYTRTLQAWRHAFHKNLGRIRYLGYDERFIRMWDYYLSYCEGGFAEQFTGVHQLLYARAGHPPSSGERI